jgi:hypothetical protein
LPSIAYLDSSPVFGVACQVIHRPNPTAQQIVAYFGTQGLQALYGGSRGRTFTVSGVLFDVSLSALANDEAALLSFADGNTHIFTDTWGRVWPNVIFTQEGYQPTGKPRPAVSGTNSGIVLPFSCVLVGLT